MADEMLSQISASRETSNEVTMQEEQPSSESMKCMLRAAKQRLSLFCPLDAELSQRRSSRLNDALAVEPYVTIKSGIARVDPAKTVEATDRWLANKARHTVASAKSTRIALQAGKGDAGPDWFRLPRTKLTPHFKRDLQLLKMRSAWDPKRHYKNDNHKSLISDYSQIGTILEGPTDYYSARISKRDRKKSFVEEILAAEKTSPRFKHKYNDIQRAKTSGRRAAYKRLRQRRPR
ncbi:MAG: hypothetical protein Q9220_004914 [cf. Caloplaca sp. 1 TL-2023]